MMRLFFHTYGKYERRKEKEIMNSAVWSIPAAIWLKVTGLLNHRNSPHAFYIRLPDGKCGIANRLLIGYEPFYKGRIPINNQFGHRNNIIERSSARLIKELGSLRHMPPTLLYVS